MFFTCNDPFHDGDRRLPVSEKGHGRKCKLCKAASTRRRTAEKAALRASSLLTRFSTADEWEAFNREEYIRKDKKHRYVPPIRDEFSNNEAYEDAFRRHQIRENEGGDGRVSRREYMDRDNEKKRLEYAKLHPKQEKMDAGPQVCSHCKRSQPLSFYRPSDVEKETKKRIAFDDSLSKIEDAGATRESRPQLFQEWDLYRTFTCKVCRDIDRKVRENPDTIGGQCRSFWYELRQAPCVDCGRADGYSEYDHQSDRGDKVHNLSHYMW